MSFKKYHFLTGFPRSGNTLLSAILNQNPKFYSSPLSPVCEHMHRLRVTLEHEHGLRNKENQIRTKFILKNYMNTFYSDVDKPIIFDREKHWLTPPNLPLILNYVTPNPKILFTVRNYLDVMASFVKLSSNDIQDELNKLELYINDLPINDQIAEYLSRLNSSLDLGMMCLRMALRPEYKQYVHIIDYDDLITDPFNTMKNIYSFLEEDFFMHDFNNIKKLEIDYDEKVNQNPLTHFVNSTITPSKTNYKDVFSDSIIKKYSNMNIWKNNVDK